MFRLLSDMDLVYLVVVVALALPPIGLEWAILLFGVLLVVRDTKGGFSFSTQGGCANSR